MNTEKVAVELTRGDKRVVGTCGVRVHVGLIRMTPVRLDLCSSTQMINMDELSRIKTLEESMVIAV